MDVRLFSHVVIAVSCLFLTAAQAQDVRFLEGIPDLPLAPKAQELPEEAVLFDTPAGHYMEVVLSTAAPAEVLAYYRAVLPALGWQAERDGFRKQADWLKISLSGAENLNRIIISIQPAESLEK